MAAFFIVMMAGFVAPSLQADFSLETAGAPVAPMDAEVAKKDPFIALTPGQRREIVREFKALLSMGQQEASSTHWVGNEFADCQKETGTEEYCRKCEVQMGSSRADYLFYKSGSQCRLRDVDVIVESADTVLLKELKPSARYYAGSRNGQFYLDEDGHSGQSSLRFVWKRPN